MEETEKRDTHDINCNTDRKKEAQQQKEAQERERHMQTRNRGQTLTSPPHPLLLNLLNKKEFKEQISHMRMPQKQLLLQLSCSPISSSCRRPAVETPEEAAAAAAAATVTGAAAAAGAPHAAFGTAASLPLLLLLL